MFGDCEAAKPEHGGRTEQRSFSDLSTQTRALLLSTKPQTDKELCTYITFSVSLKLKYHSINHIPPHNPLNPHMKTPEIGNGTFRINFQKAAKRDDRSRVWRAVAVETEYRSKQRVKGFPVMEC